MTLPTNKVTGETITAEHVNEIAEAVNALVAAVGSLGSGGEGGGVFPDNTLGILDPDTAEDTITEAIVALIEATSGEPITPEWEAFASAYAAGFTTYLLTTGIDQPLTHGDAIRNAATLILLNVVDNAFKQAQFQQVITTDAYEMPMLRAAEAPAEIEELLTMFGADAELIAAVLEQFETYFIPLYPYAAPQTPNEAIANASFLLGLFTVNSANFGFSIGALSASIEAISSTMARGTAFYVGFDPALWTTTTTLDQFVTTYIGIGHIDRDVTITHALIDVVTNPGSGNLWITLFREDPDADIPIVATTFFTPILAGTGKHAYPIDMGYYPTANPDEKLLIAIGCDVAGLEIKAVDESALVLRTAPGSFYGGREYLETGNPRGTLPPTPDGSALCVPGVVFVYAP